MATGQRLISLVSSQHKWHSMRHLVRGESRPSRFKSMLSNCALQRLISGSGLGSSQHFPGIEHSGGNIRCLNTHHNKWGPYRTNQYRPRIDIDTSALPAEIMFTLRAYLRVDTAECRQSTSYRYCQVSLCCLWCLCEYQCY
jgi:hypothetical protein